MKFGARTGAAPVVLGAVKLALGLALGSSLAELLRAFPQPLLGSLLIFSGVLPLSLMQLFQKVMTRSACQRLWQHADTQSWPGTTELVMLLMGSRIMLVLTGSFC